MEKTIENGFDNYLRLNRFGFICANCSCGVVVEYAIRAVKYIRGLKGNDYRDLSKTLINGSNSLWIFYFFGEVWAWDNRVLKGLTSYAGDYRQSHKYKFLVIYGLAKIYEDLRDDNKKKSFAKECNKFLLSCMNNDEDRLIKIICYDMTKNYSKENPILNITNILDFGKQVEFREIPELYILKLASDNEDRIVGARPKSTFTYIQQFFNFFPRVNEKGIELRAESLRNLLEEEGLELGKTVNNRQGKVNNNEIIDYTKPGLSEIKCTLINENENNNNTQNNDDDDEVIIIPSGTAYNTQGQFYNYNEQKLPGYTLINENNLFEDENNLFKNIEKGSPSKGQYRAK